MVRVTEANECATVEPVVLDTRHGNGLVNDDDVVSHVQLSDRLAVGLGLRTVVQLEDVVGRAAQEVAVEVVKLDLDEVSHTRHVRDDAVRTLPVELTVDNVTDLDVDSVHGPDALVVCHVSIKPHETRPVYS